MLKLALVKKYVNFYYKFSQVYFKEEMHLFSFVIRTNVARTHSMHVPVILSVKVIIEYTLYVEILKSLKG